MDAFVFGSGDLSNGVAGLGLSYEHRYTDLWSGFVDGRVGFQYGPRRGLRYDVLAGIRGSW